MASRGRTGTLFVAGIVLGAAVGGWAALSLHSGEGTRVATRAPVPATPSARPANAPAKAIVAAAPAAPAPRQEAAVAVHCDFSPMVGKSRSGDGQERLAAKPAGATEDEVASRILTGKEAAASGRARDAETAFLDACRKAETLRSPKGTPVADAMYQLGRHYGNLALAGAAKKPELLRRSRLLYTASLQAYRARYGEKHEKTRFAQQGLARLPQGATAVASSAPPRKASTPVPAKASPVEPPRTEPAEAAHTEPPRTEPAKAPPPDVPAATGEPSARARPSFDCARARSTPEKIICSDQELSRLDRELGRLHAQAEAVARDRAAFKRQNDAEWLRREATCRDRACLQDWYAHRRDQLLDELGSQQAGR